MTNRDLAINKKVFKKRKGIRARCKKKVSSTHFRSDVTSQKRDNQTIYAIIEA